MWGLVRASDGEKNSQSPDDPSCIANTLLRHDTSSMPAACHCLIFSNILTGATLRLPQLGQAGKSRENHDGVEENTEKEEW